MTMFRLVFDGEGDEPQKRFAMIHTAFLFGAPASRSIDVMRQELVLLEKLEGISAIDPEAKDGPLGERSRAVNKDAVLLVTKAEHEMLLKIVDGQAWGRAAVRDVVALHDWIDGAERVKPSPTV